MAERAVRGLTEGEIALARTAFGDSIDYDRVRIRLGAGGNPIAWLAFRNGNPAITLRRTIHYQSGHAEDFARAPLGHRQLFIHEMTHVWQYARLGVAPFLLRYGRQFLASGLKAARMYRYDAETALFATAMLEAQAEIAAHYAFALWTGDEARKARLARALAGSGLYGL